MVATAIDNEILQRVLDAQPGQLPLEVARYFLALSFSEGDHQRMQALSEKANEGDLTPQESQALAMYVLIADFLAIVHSKARTAMNKPSPAT